MLCMHCNNEIHPDRVEFIKIAKKQPTCINCSREQPSVTLMSYGHKTAGEVVVVPNNGDGSHNAEAIRQAQRAYRRAR